MIKKAVLCLVLIVSTAGLMAQATAGYGDFIDSGNRLGTADSWDVAMGDIDGDGDIDAVVANYNAGQAVWLNNGSGTFTPGTGFGSGASFGIALGDLDGDGDLDAAVADLGGAETVWLNNGSGNFGASAHDSFGGTTFSKDIILADVDGDGDLDVVVANSNGDHEVWLNDGSANFGTTADVTFGNNMTEGIASGDVNGDGHVDLLVSVQMGGNEVWLNNGAGAFIAGDVLPVYNAKQTLLGDVDGDGDLDAICLISGTNTVWKNNGSGDFGAAATYSFTSGTQSFDGALGDVDQDGDLDVVISNDNDNQMVWRNGGTGNFGAAPISSFNSGYGRGLALADVNNDGAPDVFTTNRNQANTVWLGVPYLQVVSQSPNAMTLNVTPSSNITLNFNIPVSSTLNDNKIQVNGSLSGRCAGTLYGGGTAAVTFDPTQNFEIGEEVTVTLTSNLKTNNGTPLESPYSFQFTVQVSEGWAAFNDAGFNAAGNNRDVALGDLDNDGDLDLFVANELGGTFNRVYLNNGSGGFTDTGQSLGSAHSYDCELGDLDGDGDLDAFVANQHSANEVWLNNGSGTFSAKAHVWWGGFSLGVALGDVDGDGDLDAFVANGGQANKVWLNDGSGGFTDSGQNLGSNASYHVALGDVDGDGDLDAYVANTNEGNRVWFNNGSGIFSDSGQALGVAASAYVSLGDLDGDGDLDAYVANMHAHPDKVWLNNGSGTFSAAAQNIGPNNTVCAVLGDVDGDGDLDALTTCTDETHNELWLNDGAGTFTSAALPAGSTDDHRAALGDLDGDGDLDAVFANGGGNDVWLNYGWDYGDLPSAYGNTLLANSGARHSMVNTGAVILGASVDHESDGQVSTDAGKATNSGDDNTAGTDDEDGVVVIGNWDNGTNGGSVNVNVTGGSGYLSAWIDWNQDNDFNDAGEQIFNMQTVTAGVNTLSFDVPAGTFVPGGSYNKFSRFRLDNDNSVTLTLTGDAANGEVEDHYLAITAIPFQVSSTVPTQNAITLAPEGKISVTFNDAVNGATLNDATSFVVTGNQRGPYEGSFSGGGTSTITFNPDSSFHAGEVITVTLTSDIQSTSGSALNSVVAQFTVRAPEVAGSFGSQQLISASADSATCVHAADLDGDGDIDVLSASIMDNKIAWYENGNSWTETVITTSAAGPRSAYAADLDGDGDMDLLSASLADNKIAWYENTDGQGSYGSQQVLSTTVLQALTVHAADLDGDGDFDVITGSNLKHEDIVWFENNGAGGFSTAQVVYSNAQGVKSVYSADLDNDGDLDVLSATWGDDTIAWYANNGQGAFSGRTVLSTSVYRPNSVYAADLDGDGDVDVLSASYGDHKIAWYENNGVGAFSTEQIISTSAICAWSVHAGDMDGDGDLDVLSASPVNHKIAWYENGNSWTETAITTSAGGARSVNAADMDGDGDLDVLSASGLDDKIAWYENQSSTIRVQAKVFLEGPYDASSDAMLTTLNSSLPLTSPYSQDARTVSSIPATITDWVLVELRSTASGAAVASRSAFLRNDGCIVDDDGTTETINFNLASGDYFTVIRHRNHLAVMSAAAQTLSAGSSTLYDFTTGLDKFYGSDATLLESGVWGMYGGDCDGNGTVTFADKDPINLNVDSSGYLGCDSKNNGTVTFADKDLVNMNVDKASKVPIS